MRRSSSTRSARSPNGPRWPAFCCRICGSARSPNSAARRTCTIAGRWSYGDPPQGWRQPALDLLSQRRLNVYLDSPDPRREAEDAIARWARLLHPTHRSSSEARLQKLLDPLLVKAPIAMIGTRAEVSAAATQALIGAGVPILLAPALAIRLTMSGASAGPLLPPSEKSA